MEKAFGFLHLPIGSLSHAYKFRHSPAFLSQDIPMAKQKVVAALFFLLLGLGICSAAGALRGYEEPLEPVIRKPRRSGIDHGIYDGRDGDGAPHYGPYGI